MLGSKNKVGAATSPVVVAIAWFALVCLLAVPADADGGRWLTGYYATYNYSVMTTSQVDYTKLTHIIYWPVIPNSDGTLNTTPFGLSSATFSAGATDLVTRAHAAGAKALIGIGGDVSSGATAGFEGATTSAHQAAFISNIVSLMQHYGFDGVDINWEQITTAENANFTSFITNLRTRLNTISPLPLLTMAPETKPNGGRPDLLAPIYQKFDQINIQTYVMSGPYPGWETWYNSPLNNGGATFISAPSEPLPSIIDALADYTGLGIPESKLAMGIQFDSAVWQGGAGTSTGGVTQPKQTWTTAPSWTTLPYRQMVALITTAGYSHQFDAVADQSWLSYDPSGTGTKNEADDRFISYDDPTSISHKGTDLSPAQAGVGGTLGGAFVFEVSGDFMSTAPAGQQHPLLTAAHGMKYLLPGLVTNLTATSPTDTSAKLTWTAASGASSYKVYFENGPGTAPASLAATVSASPATISGLTSGKKYYFLVEGVNAFGSGVTAQVSVTVILPPPPAAPGDLRAYPGNSSVLLIWEASAGATSYSVYTGSGTLLASNLKTTSYERTSLTNGVSYSFYVVAVNIGGSTKSTTVSATPASVPAAPVLSSSGGNAQVKLTWTAVAGASSYTLSDGTVSHGETTLVKGLTVTSYTVTGLKNGTTYYFFVQAINAKGASWPSNESSATPLLPPSVPTGVKATPGNEIITLSWNASTSTTSYNVYKGTAKGAETLAVSTTGTAYTFNDLTNGQTYWFYVVAVNADGTSAHSAEVSATPTSPIKPPTNLTATPVSISGSVTLNWTASAGATASYDYNVYQGSASGGEGSTAVKTVTSNATTATISGLASNKSYYFEVKAVSGGQTSAASNEAVANPRVVWVPDFWGELVQVRIGGGSTTTAITFSLPQCNPNSLAVNGTKLYVACSAYTTNPDKILVYNATTIKAAPSGTLVISPLQTISSAQFSSLIGITFDAHNNLWIASNGNNEVLSISAATLNTTTPVVTVGLVDSPSAPVALAFDTDGSLWVTGLYGDGILLNFVSSQLFEGVNAVPSCCISSGAPGCIDQSGLFEEPEGVALFNGGIWVANNSTGATGTTPGRELVNLKVAAGALSVNTIFGSTSNPAESPFVCPGGLFATAAHLWVNDESYGESPPECGAAGDVASKTGGIFSFTPAQLVAKTTTISQVLSYADITGRPGFGGIFVENDQ